jgi:hypothetical protein
MFKPDAVDIVLDRPRRRERVGEPSQFREPRRQPHRELVVVVAVRAVEGAPDGGHVQVHVPVLVGEEERPVVLEHGDLAHVGGVGRGLRRDRRRRTLLRGLRVERGQRAQVGAAGALGERSRRASTAENAPTGGSPGRGESGESGAANPRPTTPASTGERECVTETAAKGRARAATAEAEPGPGFRRGTEG